MVRYTAQDAQMYLDLAKPLIDSWISSGPSHILVASTNRHSHLMAARLASYMGALNKEVEMALYYGSGERSTPKIHRQWERNEMKPPTEEPKKLIVIDDAASEETLGQLKRDYETLREKCGIRQILYFAKDKDNDNLFTEFIPPVQATSAEQTAQSP